VSPRDLPRDPGLRRTRLRGPGGPRVGAAGPLPVRRFARDARLEQLLQSLQRAFGPQAWWPAETAFEVIAGAILTQNTAWANAERALALLRADGGLTPARILALAPEELERRVRPSGTFRGKARKLRAVCLWYLEAGGLAELRRRPLEPLRDELLRVHGVGPETADAILCYAAGRRTPVVDAYARRVLGRHGLAAADAPYEELRAWLLRWLEPEQVAFEEFHALCVRAGYNHCKPAARCETCPVPTPSPSPQDP
jgi:endonuclease III related protein